MIKGYLEKVYSGFLGMNIGIRLGVPVEPTIWTYDRIRNTYGEITDYIKDFKNFAANNDINDPVYLLRVLYDDASDRPPEPQGVTRARFNYAREGVGMFWWGGYGRSTEHTAYLNPKAGIPAPRSGSIQQNGKTTAEQIGGQIFIDTWGLADPCEPHHAAEYGAAAASVSHSDEGVYGVRLFCAAIAGASETSDISEIMNAGFVEIPEDSLYRKVTDAVLSFHTEYPDDRRACHQMLVADWDYDKYGGVCYIIPNAGVYILAVVYGQGDFVRTVEIATMCGWDIDCDAGNVGTVLGVACGIDGLPERYRGPINDGLVSSGILDYLNILDAPVHCKEIAALGYRVAREEIPAEIGDSYRLGEVHLDFELSGFTHNMRVSDPFFCRTWRSTEQAANNTGSLKVLVNRMERGHQCKLFYKPFYRRDDFSDGRYSPVFTPTAYPGQTVSTKLYLDQRNGWETIGIASYVHTTSDKKDHLQSYIKLQQGKWLEVSFQIPDTDGDMVDEAGIVTEGYSPIKSKALGMLCLDDFSITGKSEYRIAFAKQKAEFGYVTPFSFDHGAQDLNGGQLFLMRCEPAFTYAGNYYATDYTVTAPVTPPDSDSHLLTIRAQGVMRGYAGGLAAGGTVKLYRSDFGYRELSSTTSKWEQEQVYELSLKAVGNTVTLLVDGKEMLSAKDDSCQYGVFGCGSLSIGRTAFGDFTVKEG